MDEDRDPVPGAVHQVDVALCPLGVDLEDGPHVRPGEHPADLLAGRVLSDEGVERDIEAQLREGEGLAGARRTDRLPERPGEDGLRPRLGQGLEAHERVEGDASGDEHFFHEASWDAGMVPKPVPLSSEYPRLPSRELE
ncbi:MAG: hypothetical protein L6R30_06305 [Thermoanaerobaculia bacterium]|nr:hypothetical protein [Thermoanaerobaculia bacterium]